MPLTYQPFAKQPEVVRLDEELHKNVPDHERMVSGVVGVVLAISSPQRVGVLKWLMFAVGSLLIRRALLGRCPLYEGMDIDRRHR